ncbi:MAG TPA: hypothetical protein VHV83_17805 [Armatimonadota bacterium]|nr:hypothetical protein [Armatimonadota bacterium]
MVSWGKRAFTGIGRVELFVIILVVGILAVILWPVFLIRHHRECFLTQCTSSQKQIATAIEIYAQEHTQRMPAAATVWTAIGVPEKVLHCFSVKSKQRRIDYGYNTMLSQLQLIDIPDPVNTVMTSDSDQRSHLLYTWRDEAPRHRDGVIASFADGHVAYARTRLPLTIPMNKMLTGLRCQTISAGSASFSKPLTSKAGKPWIFTGTANEAIGRYAISIDRPFIVNGAAEQDRRPILHLKQHGNYALSGTYPITLSAGVRSYCVTGYLRLKGEGTGVMRITRGATDIVRIFCREDQAKNTTFWLNTPPAATGENTGNVTKKALSDDFPWIPFNIDVADGYALVDIGDTVKEVRTLDGAWNQATSIHFGVLGEGTAADLYLMDLRYGTL